MQYGFEASSICFPAGLLHPDVVAKGLAGIYPFERGLDHSKGKETDGSAYE